MFLVRYDLGFYIPETASFIVTAVKTSNFTSLKLVDELQNSIEAITGEVAPVETSS
jgi:hypothetical protein